MAQSSELQHHHPDELIAWERFWVPLGGAISLSDGGFLLDPVREGRWAGGTQLRTLGELGGLRAIALLGEPGMGKSFALKGEAVRVRASGAGVTSIHVDLRSFSSDTLLCARVFDSAEVRAWKSGTDHLVLHLDSLDEALLRIEPIAALVGNELRRLPAERLSVRIASRTLTWPSALLMPVFEELWGKDSIGAFEVAPLRRIDVEQAALQQSLDPQKFIREVQLAGAVPFAIKPLTLNLLLRLYQERGSLPTSAVELYRRGCGSLCEEQSHSRLAAGAQGRLSPQQRMRLAGRLASVSMLANRYAIWTGIESAGVPEEDVTLSALVRGVEDGASPTFEITRDSLREVLDTGLFSSRGEARMGWAHQSYAEFLAADYLIARHVPPKNVLDVLRHPSGGLIPQLAMVAAWAATLDQDVRQEMIAREPVIMLNGDLTGWEVDDVAALTVSLLAGLDQMVASDFGLGLFDRYRKLAHPTLAAKLLPYITDRTRSVPARRSAMRIAEACGLPELRDHLLTVALDQSEDPHIRSCALGALETCGGEDVSPQLRPLALGGQGNDPYDEIKGQALALLWPDHLSAAEVFQNISAPRESYFGAYALFLTQTLPNSLTRETLPAALAWATRFVSQVGHTDEFKRKQLADAIFMAAWKQVLDPQITPLIATYVVTLMRGYHELFVGHDRDEQVEFRQQFASDAEGRHAILMAIARDPLDGMIAVSIAMRGVVVPDDLPWLHATSPAGATPLPVDEAVWCDFIRAVTNVFDEGHFALIYDSSARWPLLRAAYTGFLDGVPLDSVAAAEARRTHQMMKQLDERDASRPRPEPLPAGLVPDLLDRFEAGETAAWWRMNRALKFGPNGRAENNDFEYRLTALVGWREADDATRQRIITTAPGYLERANPTVDDWLGTTTFKFSDVAAYRALVLLRDLDPETYQDLPVALWRKWAPLTVAVPQETGTENSKLHEAITADATRAAPHEIADAVLRVIRSERDRQAQAEQPQPHNFPSFHILRQLDFTVPNAPLRAGLLDELRDERNTAPQFVALLEFLLKGEVSAASDFARDRFSAWSKVAERREHAIAAAVTLLEWDGFAAWPAVWPTISADAEFGREVFLRLAHHHRFAAEFYNKIDEASLTELYLWLEANFPRSNDPEQEGVRWMSPRDSLVHLRDGVLNVLVGRGTAEGVTAVRTVAARLPDQPWIAYRVLEADQIMRHRTWVPLSVSDVLNLVERPEGHLVQSPSQLADVLVAALRQYERELHGQEMPIRDLWDRQRSGQKLRPVEEDAISNHVKRFLERELVAKGVVLNREVEIGRAIGAGIGRRTDIRVDAIRKADRGRSHDTFTAIIETKGCWNPDLMTAMRTQLHDDYLVDTGAPVGIYLVAWFDKPKWDEEDGRRKRSPSWDVAEAQRQLDEKAAELPKGFQVVAVAVDCHAP